MEFSSGTFDSYRNHHDRWFRVIRGKHIVEVWFGRRYFDLRWGK